MVVDPETVKFSNVSPKLWPLNHPCYIYISTYTVLLCHREHCLAVKELYCYKEWRSAEETSHRGFAHSITLPECTSLPSQRADPSSCTAVPYIGKRAKLLYKRTFLVENPVIFWGWVSMMFIKHPSHENNGFPWKNLHVWFLEGQCCRLYVFMCNALWGMWGQQTCRWTRLGWFIAKHVRKLGRLDSWVNVPSKCFHAMFVNCRLVHGLAKFSGKQLNK